MVYDDEELPRGAPCESERERQRVEREKKIKREREKRRSEKGTYAHVCEHTCARIGKWMDG